MKKISSIVMYVLLLLGVASMIPTMIYGKNAVDTMLYYTYGILALGVLIALGMSIINIGKNPGGATKALIGIGIIAVVLVISYFLSSTEPMMLAQNKLYDNEFGLTLSDMGIYTTYFMLAAALFVAIMSAIRSSIKK